MIESSKILQKRLSYSLLGLLLVYTVVRSTFAAHAKLFWYDELLTLTMASLPNWHAIVAALRAPLDGQPPVFHVIEKFAMHLARNQEIALRIPSILAIPVSLICIFIYARKRWGELIALVCSAFLLMTMVFRYYAEEARPYSMVVACFAFASVCYQHAESRWWIVLLALSLALAQSLHYYAVLAMVPFGLAELVLSIRTHRIRWGVWVALAVGVVPLLVFWNLLAINGAYYGGHFWAPYQFTFLARTYGDFLQTGQELGAGIVAAALLGGLITYCGESGTELGGEKPTRDQEASEVALLTGLAALPLVAYVASSIMHSAFAMRYVLPATVGVSLVFGYLLSRTKFTAAAIVAVSIVAFLAVQELSFWRSLRRDAGDITWTPAGVEKFVAGAGHGELPVVIPNGLLYVGLAHYGSPSLLDRVIYVAQDPPGKKNGRATFDEGMYIFQSYWPFRMVDFKEFTAAHKRFLIYVEERSPGRDSLTPRLLREGWSLETVELDDFRRVYLASAGGAAAK